MRTFDTVFRVGLLVLFVLFSVFGDPLAEPLLAAPILAFGLAGVVLPRASLGVNAGGGDQPVLQGTVGRTFVRLVAVANALIFGYMGFDTVAAGERAD